DGQLFDLFVVFVPRDVQIGLFLCCHFPTTSFEIRCGLNVLSLVEASSLKSGDNHPISTEK
ncbi:MAG: hypothetical protein VX024_04745, partial [SAR324 cluster bacterium]|nr:hypothetical protein [SAR324 cluster bacterium]